MAAEQRKLLEQLMGSNVMASTGNQATQFTDSKVCRSFLVGDCPHDMFVNTKLDLGLCPKIHSDQLKLDYKQAATTKEYGYEFDYQRDLAKYVDECNRRVELAQRRLEKTPEEVARSNTLIREATKLEDSIHLALQEVAVLGEIGEVTRALDEFYKIDKLKVDKELREKELLDLNTGADDHQKLQVCDVCGAYLSKLDNDRRLADHFGGKLHMGYSRMRSAAEANDKVIEKKKAMGIMAPPREEERSDYSRDRDRDRNYGQSNSQSNGGYRGGRGRGRGRGRY